MKPGWLPDWTDPEAYPDPKKTSLQQWAWEFLRRNPEYQRDYKKSCTMPCYAEIEANQSVPGGLEGFFCNPPALPGELKIDYLDRVGTGKINDYEASVAEKYGITSLMIDPADPDGIFMTGLKTQYLPCLFVSETEDLQATIGLKPDSVEEVVFKINLSWKVEPQLQYIKERLNKIEQYLKKQGKISSGKRNSTKLYQEYLRVLDAEASGASVREMSTTLVPDKPYSDPGDDDQTIKNYLKAAKKLRDYNYLYIAIGVK
ncbi:MAG: hypothetical protein HQL69_23190 [Magnetococcales bacterium]|nr:hypothetical protein [Magnetococcales bacterium]